MRCPRFERPPAKGWCEIPLPAAILRDPPCRSERLLRFFRRGKHSVWKSIRYCKNKQTLKRRSPHEGRGEIAAALTPVWGTASRTRAVGGGAESRSQPAVRRQQRLKRLRRGTGAGTLPPVLPFL